MIRFIHANNGEVLTIEIDGEAYTPEKVRERLLEWDQSEEEATRWAMKYAQMCEALKLERAGTVARDERIRQDAERIRQLELSLIDLENWIIAAEPLVPFGLPASYGQWRRPEGTK